MACMPTHACMQVHEVAAALQGRLNGSMCGDSALGLWSPDALGMQALADLAAFGESNDGAVPASGCHPPR